MSGGVYLRNKGFVTGPFSTQQVLKLVRDGKFTRIHEFSTDGETWRPGYESSFLREAGRPPRRAAATPPPNHSGGDSASSQGIDQWYYGNGVQRVGPVSTTALADLISSGNVSQQTLVWKVGMETWKPAASITQLNPIFINTQLTQKPRKSRLFAGTLALFLGGLGVHRLYLQDWKGSLYPVCLLIVLSPKIMRLVSEVSVLVPYEQYAYPASLAILLLTLVESYYLWCTPDDKWRRKWSGR